MIAPVPQTSPNSITSSKNQALSAGRKSPTEVKNFDDLLESNRAKQAANLKGDPNYYNGLKEQHPNFFLVSCSDSRVDPHDISGMHLGGVFKECNIANQASLSDKNFQSELEFAVNVLKVPNIVVCGHEHCGGVTRAMELEE